MNVGFLGLGKLGLPVALAAESRGHKVRGWDIDMRARSYAMRRSIPYIEAGAAELLRTTRLRIAHVDKLVAWADLIFVAVQTPHQSQFEGVTPMPADRSDFDYTHLVSAVTELAVWARRQRRAINVAVISTCLPGTFHSQIEMHLNEFVSYVYNPFFIAMGTAIDDFLHPEFVLLGHSQGAEGGGSAAEKLRGFYSSVHGRPVFETDITTAELIKVAYNTFIGQKIVFANAMMEICHKLGGNVDDLTAALSLADQRIVSPKYMRGGMGDGGGCHPRDNIAMSWLARRLSLSSDIFESVMRARERQTKWLVELTLDEARTSGLPTILLGTAYKPQTNLEVGSPALLWLYYFRQRDAAEATVFDPHVTPGAPPLERPAVFFLGTCHEEFRSYSFPEGSVVIDPWGYLAPQGGVSLISVGRNSGSPPVQHPTPDVQYPLAGHPATARQARRGKGC